MNKNINIEFEDSKINIIRLLSVLKENKDQIERNNAVVLLSTKYMKEIVKKYPCAQKKDANRELILLSSKNTQSDFNYSLIFEGIKVNSEKFYKITKVKTNDPEFDGTFVEPNYSNDVSSINLIKKGEKVLNNTKK